LQEEYEDDSPGYSPVLENYTRFSDLAGASAAPIINKSNIPSASSSTSSAAPKASQTPPMSPSFLRVGNNTNNDYFRQTNNDDYIFTTRSSSLNRAISTSSGKSIIHVNQNAQRMVPPSPSKFLFSNPTSPLAFEVKTPALHESEGEFPNHAFLSYMASHFIDSVARLNERRRIYCSAEYPLSFTGEEAFVSLVQYAWCRHCFTDFPLLGNDSNLFTKRSKRKDVFGYCSITHVL
jgi:hypothetical protein